MNEPQLEELISAYLDDQVTDEERSLVEQALRENAELRQLLDELRSLQAVLRSFPRLRLDDGFAARVTQQAQTRQASTEREGGEASEPSIKADHQINGAKDAPVVVQEAVVRETPAIIPFDRRRWTAGIMTVAAVAAAILFVLFRPIPTENGLTHDPKPPSANNGVAGAAGETESSQLANQGASQERTGQESSAAGNSQPQLAERGNPASSNGEKMASVEPSRGGNDTTQANPANERPSAPAPNSVASNNLRTNDARPGDASPKPAETANVSPAVASSLRMVNLAEPSLQVARIAAQRKTLENRLFDELLARHSIPFRMAAPHTPERAQRWIAATVERGFDLIYVEAGRRQIQGFLNDLNRIDDKLPVIAVYRSPKGYLDLIVSQTRNLDKNEDDPTADSGVPANLLEASGQAVAVLAWRPRVENWEEVDRLFPTPKDGSVGHVFSDREWDDAANADPDGTIRMVFVLRLSEDEQR